MMSIDAPRIAGLFLCAVFVAGAAFGGGENPPVFRIDGTVAGVDDGEKVSVVDMDMRVIAASTVSGGKYTLQGPVDYPQIAALTIGRRRTDMVLEGATYRAITEDGYLTTVVGGHFNDQVYGFRKLPEYRAALENAKRVGDTAFAGLDMKDEKAVKEARARFSAATGAVDAIERNHARKIMEGNGPALLKLLVLQSDYNSPRYSDEERAAYLAAFERELGNHPLIVRARASLRAVEEAHRVSDSLAVGKHYKDIGARDIDGKAVKLSEVLARNKMVLLDFWASWCGPCRAEFPHLKKVYQEFHERGFEIYAISIDESKPAWRKALDEEKVPWINLLDTNREEDAAAKIYSVSGVPANYLIGADGVIVARNLREWDVERVVREKIAPASEADNAWQALETLSAAQPPRDIPQEQAGTWAEKHLVQLSDDSSRFMGKYPDDPRYWKAAGIFTRTSGQLAGMNEMRARMVKRTMDKALTSTTISSEDWAPFKATRISERMQAYGDSKDRATDLAAIRAELDVLAQRAPSYHALGYMEMQYVSLLEAADPAAATAQLEKLAAGGNKQAAGRLKKTKARQNPVELKFVALDGRKVDLKKMRGKAVLLDFWATWCGPCKEELPNLKAVYRKYHGRGFEVVGISLDSRNDREKLEAFIEAQQLPWPQYLDETNERNRIAEEYGIDAIPAPLLFDRKGLLVEEDARGEALEEMVRKLLEGG